MHPGKLYPFFTPMLENLHRTHPRITVILDSVSDFVAFGVLGYVVFLWLKKDFLFSKKREKSKQ